MENLTIEKLLVDFVPDSRSRHAPEVQQAVYLARLLQNRSVQLQTPQERRQQSELDRLIQNPGDKATLVQLTDQAFRSGVPQRVVNQIIHILDVQGIPRFFSPVDRTLLKGFQSFGSYLPGVAVPLVKEKMHQETANVVLPAEHEMLTQHLDHRRHEGVRMNVNFLGEALLGELEARRRLKSYLAALQLPEIEVVSVKISTIYSQISSIARKHTIAVLCDRLEHLYRCAAKMRFRRNDGSEVSKFVYLDMEEYRDMGITAEVFMQTLDRPGLERVRAGIALQAYIPDAFGAQREIHAWARDRVAAGGAPVTIRVVKGANMEMERVEASVRGWPQAPFKTKIETDANYKRMICEALQPENRDAVHLGIASHNLFDVSYGLVLAHRTGAIDRVQFEMLEGMANHQRRALFDLNRNVLLYAPACTQADFVHAIGYLIRRLDENTGQDNFLRHAFKLQVDSPEWEQLEKGFLAAFDRLESLRETPRRDQNRNKKSQRTHHQNQDWTQLVNEVDTDFSLPENVSWAEKIVRRWQTRCNESAANVPLVIDGLEIFNRSESTSWDPSRPNTCVARFRRANEKDIERAVACARNDDDAWRKLTAEVRCAHLDQVADEIRSSRDNLIGAALAEGGKAITESDPEISEAIDFVEFYPRSARHWEQLDRLSARGKGVVVVVSPWNFPISIPCGGIAAALAAGNTVILKPASDTVLVAHELCQCFWRAGISQKTLQFAPCTGSVEGQILVSHDKVDVVILTGGTETALSMLDQHPEMNLLAETGGKNATVVTALADRDQAVKHVVQSAFGHAGQKCSATSLLILEDEVYQDVRFRETLSDAVRSLPVGSAWNLTSRVTPLIRPPSGVLERGLKDLEPNESWAVIPEKDQENPCLYSPGIKWGIPPDQFTHTTELFGPVLGVMQAKNLEDAISLVNRTGYGLTSGLESLDDREQDLWMDTIKAGNLYINRSTTGAVVLRQPFGGMRKSVFGPGIKAGGPNYVAQFMDFEDRPWSRDSEPREMQKQASSFGNPPLEDFVEQLRCHLVEPAGWESVSTSEFERVMAAINSYCHFFDEEFSKGHDHFRLIGQDNVRRYLPVKELRIRIHPEDSIFDTFARVAAAQIIGSRITISIPVDFQTDPLNLLDEITESWAASIEFVEESDETLTEILRTGQTDRIRYADRCRVPQIIRTAAASTGFYIADAPVLGHGRIELLWYVQEQSICNDYHRYGNLGARVRERRSNVE